MEFVEETLSAALKRAEDEGAEVQCCDEAGFQVGDQIGTTHAPCGQTPVPTLPKIRIAQNMIASVTPTGELTYELYSGTMNAARFMEWLERLNNDVKQNLKNEPLPGDTPDFRATLERILDNISGFPDRIKGFFRQSHFTTVNSNRQANLTPTTHPGSENVSTSVLAG